MLQHENPPNSIYLELGVCYRMVQFNKLYTFQAGHTFFNIHWHHCILHTGDQLSFNNNESNEWNSCGPPGCSLRHMLRGAFAGEAPINITMDEDELKALNQLLESWEKSCDHVGKLNTHETV